MSTESTIAFKATTLERGGVLVEWGEFRAQIGAYPETIKDTIVSSEGVPQIFILPERLFDIQQGVTMAELEFPVYFNFYVKQRTTRFVCRQEQLGPILQVLKESVFGPAELDYAHEYHRGRDSFGFPDLADEMSYFKEGPDGRKLQLNDMVTPRAFDRDGVAEIDGVVIEALPRDHYRFRRGSEQHEVAFSPLPFESLSLEGQRYTPPVFGVTVIGSGHGFDAKSSTSGFLIWLNGRGVLVDPPVHSTDWLRRSGIDTRLVEDIILTHCHADHDSGTLQKVLQEGRVVLHTTPTVLESFMRKYGGVTGLTSTQFRSLFDFQTVTVGEPMHIAGGRFCFKYTFHPIPTLGFDLEFGGKRFAYSCDTLYEPTMLGQLADSGRLSQDRVKDLLDFPFDADLVFHEAGVPPIHTPTSVLAELPEEKRRNLYLTHVSDSAVPSTLRLAPTGVENTLTIKLDELPDVTQAQKMLEVLAHIEIFQEFRIRKALEFLSIADYMNVEPGTVLIRTGEPGDKFFVIISGDAQVIKDGEVIKVASRFDYFGEMALVLSQPRYADVVALTAMEVLAIGRREFLNFIEGTGLHEVLERVSANKMQGSWPVLGENRLLGPLTTYQKTQLLAFMELTRFEAGEVLFSVGQAVDRCFLIDEGKVRLTHPDGDSVSLGRGAFLAGLTDRKEESIYRVNAGAVEPTMAYVMPAGQVRAFFGANPGTYVRLLAGLHHNKFCYLP
ncbi:MAG: cyclic nucleotide-binding domain-containing protein [Vulcanimicrobiota bacterium]